MRKKRLVLHVGMPKTGTTAIQYWFNDSREILNSFGIYYPKARDPIGVPRYQYLLGALLQNNFLKIKDLFSNFDKKTLLLSNEALSFRYGDFSEEALKQFRQLTKEFNITVFMVVRERSSWTKSWYKQSVINPPTKVGHFGTAYSYEDFCNTTHIEQLINIELLCQNMTALYGAHELVVVRYEENWLKAFFDLLEIANEVPLPQLIYRNTAISDDLVELIRQINSLGFTISERANIMANIQKQFATNHDILRAYTFVEKCGAKVFKKLQPKNLAQAEMIHDLIIGQVISTE